MLSGIMAIFEMGLAVTGQSLFSYKSSYHDSNYFKNTSLDRKNDIKLIKDLSGGSWRKDFIDSNPGVEISCANYYESGNYSWKQATVGRCESYGDGRRIVVDIVADEVLFICIPKQDLGKCFFEEES